MFLKQSTASQTRLTPRFVDDTDFKTPETGLTIANTDVKLSKNGGASANKNSGGGTHIEAGRYALTFDATDTATVGELAVGIVMSGALPVEFKYFVVEEAVFDALYAASAVGYVADQPVNATKFGGTTVTGRDLGASVLLSPGTGTGQIDLTSGIPKANVTQFNGSAATSAAGIPAVNTTQFAGQTVTAGAGVTLPSSVASPTNITAGTITTATNVTNVNGIAAGVITAASIAAAALNGKGDWNIGKTGYALSSAGVQAIWDALTSALTAVGSIGKLLVDNINATISSRLASASYTTPPTAVENADALLKRDWTSVTGEASRSTLNALRFLRNKWTISAGVLAVKKEDDATNAWTGAVTTAAGNPVTEIDPA